MHQETFHCGVHRARDLLSAITAMTSCVTLGRFLHLSELSFFQSIKWKYHLVRKSIYQCFAHFFQYVGFPVVCTQVWVCFINY